jgi:hypothetical protein
VPKQVIDGETTLRELERKLGRPHMPITSPFQLRQRIDHLREQLADPAPVIKGFTPFGEPILPVHGTVVMSDYFTDQRASLR